MAVFILDRQGKTLMPCTEKRARLLLVRGRARVHRVVPFVIRLVDRGILPASTPAHQARPGQQEHRAGAGARYRRA